jgi:uncharacterized protein YndB with AHSA1/START domain
MSRTPGQRRAHVGRAVNRQIRIDAPPQDVYDAWADPQRIAAWFVDHAEGVAAPGALMTWVFDAFKLRLPVPIVEASPPNRLVMAGDRPAGLPFLQEVIIERDGGETLLRIVNSGFSDASEADDEFEGVESGWQLALATLKQWLERYRGRPRQHVFAMRSGVFACNDVQPYFTTSRGLCAWLCEAADLPHDLDAGDQTALRMIGLGGLNGRVLARSRREALLDWPERQGVLGLKTFGVGPGATAIALDVSLWDNGSGAADLMMPALDAALERLRSRL